MDDVKAMVKAMVKAKSHEDSHSIPHRSRKTHSSKAIEHPNEVCSITGNPNLIQDGAPQL